MSTRIPPIREFPIDGRIWRIDWLGMVERTSSEALIDVFLSPARPGVFRPQEQEHFDPAQNLNRIIHADDFGQSNFVWSIGFFVDAYIVKMHRLHSCPEASPIRRSARVGASGGWRVSDLLLWEVKSKVV